jgi:hypothetical protein
VLVEVPVFGWACGIEDDPFPLVGASRLSDFLDQGKVVCLFLFVADWKEVSVAPFEYVVNSFDLAVVVSEGAEVSFMVSDFDGEVVRSV